jgi:hypothetical protein
MLATMTDQQLKIIRKQCLRDFFSFCQGVMGYDEISEEPHGAYCRFLQGPERRKQSTMPRSFVKTWIGTIAFSCYVTLPREEEDEFPYYKAWEDKMWTLGTDIRVLVASYVVTNAEKMISLIRKTYESNVAMQILFPEIIPTNFRKTKWTNQSACLDRTEESTESTFEAAGIGGSATSRHYDLIIEDDLIYAKKDDFSGQELQPSQEDIDKAIGWHKIADSLLVPGKHTRIHNQGTRWAKHDLIDYIWTQEKYYATFRRACVQLTDDELSGKADYKEIDWQTRAPTWAGVYDHEDLLRIATAQGPYMFATQYLLMPMSPEEMLFKKAWLQIYKGLDTVPDTVRKFTTVDLASWDENTRKKGLCDSVIMTCGWCDKNHCWIMHYDVGRFDPSQVIQIMAKHWDVFKPESINIEEVYYQSSLAHFAHRYMDEGKVPRMTIRGVRPESNRSKELRIRGLEPYASSFAIHCRDLHHEFIKEFEDYIPNNSLCKKDLLDTLAYQLQVARPGAPHTIVKERKRLDNKMVVVTGEAILKSLLHKESTKDAFGNPAYAEEPFVDREDYNELDMTAWATDPFNTETIEIEYVDL